MNDSSSDISRVAEQLVGHFRNIMIAKAVKKPGELIVCQKEELVRYMNAGEGFSMARILEILDAFQQTAEKMKKAASKRVELEMAFVSLCVNEQSKAVGEVPVQNGYPGGTHSFQSTSAIGAQNFRNAAQNGFSEGTQIGHNLQNTDQSGVPFADGSVTAAERKTGRMPVTEQPVEACPIPKKALSAEMTQPTEKRPLTADFPFPIKPRWPKKLPLLKKLLLPTEPGTTHSTFRPTKRPAVFPTSLAVKAIQVLRKNQKLSICRAMKKI